MRIHIDQINEDGLRLEFEEKAEFFPALTDMIQAGDCEFTAPLKIRLTAVRIRDIVEVEGRVDTLVRLPCSRCLQRFEMPLTSQFALTYTPRPRETKDVETEEELELRTEDLQMIPFEGDEIDLRDAVQEQIIMALPIQPLCSEQCKGLCPICGANLNQGDCGCDQKSSHNKFAELKNLKLNNQTTDG